MNPFSWNGKISFAGTFLADETGMNRMSELIVAKQISLG
jgi:hypothetical protein